MMSARSFALVSSGEAASARTVKTTAGAVETGILSNTNNKSVPNRMKAAQAPVPRRFNFGAGTVYDKGAAI
jgi:hypothetical protein